MLLNEIINEVGMTKRAVKYYEEKGLLSVDKDNNGYRNYTAQDVETLKKISVYRKLGISAYSARTAHPFQRNGAPFRFKLSKAQQVD